MGRFHELQMVSVLEEEVLGYVVSVRQNVAGTEYHVMYWRGAVRSEGWFDEIELEPAP